MKTLVRIGRVSAKIQTDDLPNVKWEYKSLHCYFLVMTYAQS